MWVPHTPHAQPSSPSSSPKGPSLALIRTQQRLNKDGLFTTWGGGAQSPGLSLLRPRPPCFALTRRGLGRLPGCCGLGDTRSRSGFSEGVLVTVTAPQDGSSSWPVQGGAPLPGNPGRALPGKLAHASGPGTHPASSCWPLSWVRGQPFPAVQTRPKSHSTRFYHSLPDHVPLAAEPGTSSGLG